MQGLGRRGEQEARRRCGEGKGKKRTLGTHGKKTEVEIRSSQRKVKRRLGALWRGTLEWKRIDAKERKETDAVGGGAPWKAASGAQSSTAEIGPSGESRVGVNQKGSLERRKAEESASGEVFQEIRQHVGQSWESSQLEDELVDWNEDDEMMRQWDKVNKEEERLR